jgi:hypothetical protein
LVRAALQTELARLFAAGDFRGAVGGALAHLPVASIHLAQNIQPAPLGRQIAGALYHGLAPAPASPPASRSKGGGAP